METLDSKILRTEMLTPPAHEPGAIPEWLHEQGADVVIVGGLGERAQQLLREKGMEVIIGAPMDAPESLANQYLAKTLVAGANICDH
ncbi:MAG: ATPase [Deltaproteobacteria bacterium]|nr:ATPase [Deltaproteobacteria bacterium]